MEQDFIGGIVIANGQPKISKNLSPWKRMFLAVADVVHHAEGLELPVGTRLTGQLNLMGTFINELFTAHPDYKAFGLLGVIVSNPDQCGVLDARVPALAPCGNVALGETGRVDRVFERVNHVSLYYECAHYYTCDGELEPKHLPQLDYVLTNYGDRPLIMSRVVVTFVFVPMMGNLSTSAAMEYLITLQESSRDVLWDVLTKDVTKSCFNSTSTAPLGENCECKSSSDSLCALRYSRSVRCFDHLQDAHCMMKGCDTSHMQTSCTKSVLHSTPKYRWNGQDTMLQARIPCLSMFTTYFGVPLVHVVALKARRYHVYKQELKLSVSLGMAVSKFFEPMERFMKTKRS
jgi:hypothetical protein